MSGFGHGSVGTREQAFTTLLDLRKEGYPPHQLVKHSCQRRRQGSGEQGAAFKGRFFRISKIVEKILKCLT
jgi:hypothetical protein